MLLGHCADAQAMGFGDYIGMMIGVTPQNRVNGIRVLTIAETPGIGMEVAEPDYLAGYEAGDRYLPDYAYRQYAQCGLQ